MSLYRHPTTHDLLQTRHSPLYFFFSPTLTSFLIIGCLFEEFLPRPTSSFYQLLGCSQRNAFDPAISARRHLHFFSERMYTPSASFPLQSSFSDTSPVFFFLFVVWEFRSLRMKSFDTPRLF